jgi:hypothetical protein
MKTKKILFFIIFCAVISAGCRSDVAVKYVGDSGRKNYEDSFVFNGGLSAETVNVLGNHLLGSKMKDSPEIFIRELERLYESGSTIKECIKRLPLQTHEEIKILSSSPLSPEHSGVDILYQVRRSMENILPGTFYLCDTGFCAIQITSMLLQKYGKFPEDAAVIAFDHTDNCALFSPGISAVELNADLFAQKCMELLKRRIRERNADFCAVDVPTAFIERDTF